MRRFPPPLYMTITCHHMSQVIVYINEFKTIPHRLIDLSTREFFAEMIVHRAINKDTLYNLFIKSLT